MESIHYTVEIHPAAEGGYWAEVPALAGCFTQADSLEEVTARVREAMECHLSSLLRDGLPFSRRETSQESLRLSRDGACAENGVTRLPQLDAARLIRALKRAGFIEHEHRGSHLTLKHPNGFRTTVPTHSGDLDRGLMKAIIKQAGLTEDVFRELL